MKQICILFVLVFTAFGVRADLVMELNLPISGLTNDTIVKIKGDKIRQDSVLNGQKASSRIADLKTGEIFTWGDIPNRITTNSSILLNQTNAAVEKAKWSKIQDTGKTEMVNGYEAKIYIWTNSGNYTETLWVAKNFPDFKKIKADLAKLDKLNNGILMPELSSLTGMPLKLHLSSSLTTNESHAISLTLVSAKEESIDDSAFELPKIDHVPTVVATNTGPPLNVLTATNLDEWKAAVPNLFRALPDVWNEAAGPPLQFMIGSVPFKSDNYSIYTRGDSKVVSRIGIRSAPMNIADLRALGNNLLQMMGKDKTAFNSWCDKAGENFLRMGSGFGSDSANSYLPNGKVYGFEISSFYGSSDKEWIIEFVVTDR